MEQESLFDEEKIVNKESPKQSYSAEDAAEFPGGGKQKHRISITTKIVPGSFA